MHPHSTTPTILASPSPPPPLSPQNPTTSSPPPPKTPIRIAILVCDNMLPGAEKLYGGYMGLYTALLHAGADTFGWPRDRLKIRSWDVVGNRSGENGEEEKGFPALGDVDAVLVSGSRYSAFETAPWLLRLLEFVRAVLAQTRVRLLGVCFGLQVIAHAMGATVARNALGFEVSVCEVQLTERGRALFDGRETLNIMQMHQDIISHHPAGTEALGASAACAVQGMYARKRLLGVEGHPEFHEDIMRELLTVRRAKGVLSEAVFRDGIARVERAQDADVVGRAFVRFLVEE